MSIRTVYNGKLRSSGEQNFIQKLVIGHLLASPAVLSAAEDRYRDELHTISVSSLPFPQEGIKFTSALSQQFTIHKPTGKTLTLGRKKVKKV